MQELARYWTETTSSATGGQAQRAPAVHHRDRRRGHPLHPRALPARGRATADHDPRLARLHGRLLETIGPLTDPTAHGGNAEDAFHLVLPSFPGYGFSGEPTEVGWDPGRTARAWAELMNRLGYSRYVAQGGDVGASVTDPMGRHAPEGLIGNHLNFLMAALAGARARGNRTGTRSGRGARDLQAGRLRLLPGEGDASTDDRLRAARFARGPGRLDARPRHRQLRQDLPRLCRRRPAGGLTRDHILDNVTLYWLTGTGASAARSYWEGARALAAALACGEAPPEVSLPVGLRRSLTRSAFPAQLGRAGLPRLSPIQRGREGRALRRLGGAGALLRGAPSRVDHIATETRPD